MNNVQYLLPNTLLLSKVTTFGCILYLKNISLVANVFSIPLYTYMTHNEGKLNLFR